MKYEQSIKLTDAVFNILYAALFIAVVAFFAPKVYAWYKTTDLPEATPTYAQGEIAKVVLTGERVQVISSFCQKGAEKCYHYHASRANGTGVYREFELMKDGKQ